MEHTSNYDSNVCSISVQIRSQYEGHIIKGQRASASRIPPAHLRRSQHRRGADSAARRSLIAGRLPECNNTSRGGNARLRAIRAARPSALGTAGLALAPPPVTAPRGRRGTPCGGGRGLFAIVHIFGRAADLVGKSARGLIVRGVPRGRREHCRGRLVDLEAGLSGPSAVLQTLPRHSVVRKPETCAALSGLRGAPVPERGEAGEGGLRF